MPNIVNDKYSKFTVSYSMVFVNKEGKLLRFFGKSRQAYSIQFPILQFARFQEKKRIIRFIMSL